MFRDLVMERLLSSSRLVPATSTSRSHEVKRGRRSLRKHRNRTWSSICRGRLEPIDPLGLKLISTSMDLLCSKQSRRGTSFRTAILVHGLSLEGRDVYVCSARESRWITWSIYDKDLKNLAWDLRVPLTASTEG